MYYIVYGLFYLFSLLPLRLLYIISDLAYNLIYYVIHYRRDVVMVNLSKAFPQKSSEEKDLIAKKFYRNFTDNFIEIIKLMSVGDKFIRKHFSGDFSILDKIHASGKSCNILLGHNFNWEWGNYAVSLQAKLTFLVVYMPIKSQVMDRLFKTIRTKGNSQLLSAHHMRRDFMPFRKSQYALILAADQNPGDPKIAYWLNFFGRPAPFVTGPEKGVRPQNLPVVFCKFHKVKRGYYHLEMTLMEDNPKALKEGELTRRFVRKLEEAITKDPEIWLWSHKRWKHEWKESYQSLWVDDEPPALMNSSNT